MSWERIHKSCEFLSFVAVVIGVPIALIELHAHAADAADAAKKQRIEAAEKIYRDVDQRYMDFMKLCIEHPRLDCYSLPQGGSPPLSADELMQQKILYSTLSDVFEVAFVQYHKPNEDNPDVIKLYKDQWAGWDAYIRKFLGRRVYRQTWREIKDEYDKGFVAYMDTIPAPPGG